jgi:hypothetical protein
MTNCVNCGAEIEDAVAYLEVYGVAPRRCRAATCRETIENDADEVLAFQCRDCPRTYLLDRRTRTWFLGRYGLVPRRCDVCRGKRRRGKLSIRARREARAS